MVQLLRKQILLFQKKVYNGTKTKRFRITVDPFQIDPIQTKMGDDEDIVCFKFSVNGEQLQKI